ncbi:MAG: S41 family peptidase [Verrucomicrobia bacterium]|nr:S41 family peptidase [Verrucomicrobiota bacterium]
MKTWGLAIFCSFGFAAFAAEEASAPPVPPQLHEAVNALDATQVQKAIDVLRTNFLSADDLDDDARQRALLEGLAIRLAPGVSIVPAASESKPKDILPFLAEIIDNRAGYIRPGALDADSLGQTDVALKNFTDKQMPATILDLRAVPGGSEFDVAADFARRFTPKGKILFTIQKPNAKQERILTSDMDPAFKGILIVLTDSDTLGAAEVLAATLRQNAGAMIIGAETAGAAVEFSDFPLGSDQLLRVAVSRVSVPEAGSLFPDGVKPDISISLPADVQARLFELSREHGVSEYIFDKERPRMNEAALVANTNPEIGATEESADEEAVPPRDTVLQRAMDIVTAITFYKKAK